MELTSYLNYMPLASIIFVGILFIWKLYFKIRSKFDVGVNCWFCNKNSKINWESQNCWDCPHCEQYNGFTKDGDYNREIIAQRESVRGFTSFCQQKMNYGNNLRVTNGLCNTCNDNQEIKIQKLADFEPENEADFDEELLKYKENLETAYRLCRPCRSKVKTVLDEKKKMILGSKLYQFAIQGSAPIREYLKTNPIIAKKTIFLKNIISFSLFTLAIVNFVDLILKFDFSNLQFDGVFGQMIGNFCLIIAAHITAFLKVIFSYLQFFLNIRIIEKSILYIRTMIFLASYTMGFNINTISIRALIFAGIPFGNMFLAFGNNILDGFKINRYTFLLTLWSFYAALQNIHNLNMLDLYKILTSMVAIGLSFPTADDSQKAKQCLNSSTNSFHRIYSKDYLSSDNDSTIYDSPSRADSSFSFSTKVNNSFSELNFPNNKQNFHYPQSCIGSPSIISTKSAFQNYSKNNINTIPLNSSSPIVFKPNNFCNGITNNLNINTSDMNNDLHCHNRAAINSNQLNLHNTRYSSPLSPALSCSSISTQRQNLISPSRLDLTGRYDTFPIQSSWISGGYFNSEYPTGKKSLFIDNLQNNKDVSRASSQSSGFESHTSSALNGEKNVSRENSFCGDIDPLLSSSSSLYQGNTIQSPIELQSPVMTSLKSFYNPSAGVSTLKSFHSQNSLSSPSSTVRFLKLTSQSTNHPPYLHNLLTIDCNQSYNIGLQKSRETMSPFDFKKMNNYLPSIEKRYML